MNLLDQFIFIKNNDSKHSLLFVKLYEWHYKNDELNENFKLMICLYEV